MYDQAFTRARQRLDINRALAERDSFAHRDRGPVEPDGVRSGHRERDVLRTEPKGDIDRSRRADDRTERVSQETVDGQVDAGGYRAWFPLNVQCHVRLSPPHLLDQCRDLPDAGLGDEFSMV